MLVRKSRERGTTLLLTAVAATLVWRIARRLVSRQAAVVAAVVVWLWPANYLWWSIKARGFYEATLCITLACALLMLRIDRQLMGEGAMARIVV